MTRVKVCGIRRAEDAALAVELGASALGFIFWPSSPRFVDPDAAMAVIATVPPFVSTVGVFVDQGAAHVAEVARALKLSAVQLHGSEQVDAYDGAAPQVVKAIPVGDDGSAERLVRALPARVGVLLDAHDPVKRGGTGRTIDWTRAAELARMRPIILSGGLNADNVGDAIDAVRPYAIDVSSGVESRPGEKDAGKLRAFFAALDHHAKHGKAQLHESN
jgi:phosphoribosylanthranilate isomerase